MSDSSLTIVGTGIRFVSHLTIETNAYIKQSQKVLYLINDPAMKIWIERNSISSESLDPLYNKHPLRRDNYNAIADYILEAVRKPQHVCVALYGHPAVFSSPGLEAVRRARQEGIDARILPGISAEDCLFADLLLDPGTCGCQSFEATDLLIYKRKVDPSSHLILWQAGLTGCMGSPEKYNNQQGLTFLKDYLLSFYPKDHPVILYEAAQYPGLEATIQKLTVSNLLLGNFTAISTLYIPPAKTSLYDTATCEAPGIISPT